MQNFYDAVQEDDCSCSGSTRPGKLSLRNAANPGRILREPRQNFQAGVYGRLTFSLKILLLLLHTLH